MEAKQIEEICLALGILGALLLGWGSLRMVFALRSYAGPSDTDHRRERWTHIIGAILIAIGFAGTLWRLLGR